MLKYNKNRKEIEKINSFSIPSNEEIVWFHIDNRLNTFDDELQEKLNLHPLALNAMNSFSNTPKVSMFKNEAVLSIATIKPKFEHVKMNILVRDNFIITNEEKNNLNFFSEMSTYFQNNPDQMANTGHILYEIINKISFVFLEVVDEIADEIQHLEKSVFKAPFANEIGRDVYRWKTRLHSLRQIIEPQENAIKEIAHSNFSFIDEDTGFYFEDLQHNYARIVSAFDNFKENITSIFNLQISLKSDHTNAIMKTLTLVSVIFIPMTFIAGLYGMNFEYMPELKWQFGYFLILTIMLGVGAGIAVYFRKKGWWGKKKQ